MALAYLTATATQGAADAFVQAEIATALTGIGNVAFRVREIMFEWGSATAVNAAEIEIAISRRSKTAMPEITDRDVLMKFKRMVTFTTSGATVQTLVERFTFAEDDELLVVEDPLYLVVDSAATGNANVVGCRIGYERVSISAIDRLTLLTASLE